jgi:hypothetical protein
MRVQAEIGQGPLHLIELLADVGDDFRFVRLAANSVRQESQAVAQENDRTCALGDELRQQDG